MRDWKTPLDQIGVALEETKTALFSGDEAGMEEVLCDILEITIKLLDEVRVAQEDAAEMFSS